MASLARRRLGGIVATLLLAAACAPAASPSPAPSLAADGWVPETAWERALADVDADGRFTKEAALRLFATAYGPIPGVDAKQDLTGVFSRTIAIRAVGSVRDQLSDEQRAAIDRAISPPANAVKIVIPPAAAAAPLELAAADGGLDLLARAVEARAAVPPGGGPGAGPENLADSAIEQAIRDVGRMSRDIIASQLKRDFLGDHDFYFVPRPADVQPIEGLYPNGGTHGTYDGGVFGGCVTTIYDEATTQTAVQLAALIAHETFHCFQADAYRLVEPWNEAPHWITEGQATWVGLEVGGPSPNYNRFWKKYLTAPRIDLRTRDYDAVGFYAHLAETGTDPWTVFQDMWTAGTDHEVAFKAAHADAETFVDSWASGVVRQPARGTAWDTTGPAITPDAFAPPNAVVSDGTSVEIGAAFYTNRDIDVTLNADLVQVDVEGHVRISDGTQDLVLHDGGLYCVAGHDCKKVCDEDEQPPETVGTLGSRILVASSGSLDGTIGRISGMDRPDCQSPPPSGQPTPKPNETEPCATSCGSSNGDVHIGTLGEFGYDFQGVGEFVLARSADGRFEVQTRQSQLGDSNRVSINTALAVRAGDHRLNLFIDPDTEAVRMTVDGTETPMTDPVPFGSGAITPSNGAVHIDTGDGSHVWVIGMSYRGFNLLVEPGKSRADGLVGLMGTNPSGSRFPALPDGSAILPFTFERHQSYVQLYQTLADAWRVDAATSLFEYAPGESTETFTRRGFPAEGDLIELENLTAAQREAGEEACKRVTDSDLHAMCVYDVGVTADPGFGEMYEATITLLEAGQLGHSGERLRVANLYANEGVGTDIDVYAWAGDAMNLGTGSTTAPALVATVPYGQSSDWFDPGQLANGPFAPVNWISIQRHGDPINSWQLNLFDMTRDSKPGLERTLVITGDPDGFAIGGGTAMAYAEIAEESPDGFPLIDPPPGKALGFLDAVSMYELDQPEQYVASVAGRCLEDPDLPTLARTAQGPGAYAVGLEPGSFDVAIHAFPVGADGFDLDCSRFPTLATAHVELLPGDRVLLIPYAESASSPVRLFALRVGD
jgi:hypothetical protein